MDCDIHDGLYEAGLCFLPAAGAVVPEGKPRTGAEWDVGGIDEVVMEGDTWPGGGWTEGKPSTI